MRLAYTPTAARLPCSAAMLAVLAMTPRQTAAQDADVKARAMVAQMTLAEQDSVVHGVMPVPIRPGLMFPPGAIPGAGYVPGVPHAGFPALKETDAGLGVAYVMGLRHDGATALPASLATASSFDPDIAYAGGAVAGREAAAKGFNVLLGGGVDLARDPRGGRNFEYLGEDPLLAGTLAGAAIRGTQDQHVVSTVKHFAFNDQETLRHSMNAVIGEAAARESDLLAFEIAIRQGHPGAVMCAYNRVNGPYACGSDFLLNHVLKRDWAYPGWVMSDWGAVPGLHAALDGLDQQSGEQLDARVYFGQPLLEAAEKDKAYAARLTDMATRIARSLYAVGAIDHPAATGPIDFASGSVVARRTAEAGMVLLRNRGLLPLSTAVKRIAIIGGHADVGVLSGGGSSQVAPPGGPAMAETLGGEGDMAMFRTIYTLPSSPEQAIKALAPGASVHFDDGRYLAAAADLARRSDIAIVFATQWQMEGYDVPDLSLPDGQDALIAAVAAANTHTIVVLESGGPVLMPWLNQVGAVLEAWYPGAEGGPAIADLLFGKTSPSGRLPITFPASLAQLPRPALPGAGLPPMSRIDVDYTVEGSDVGYRYFARTGAAPLFAFGYGLTYTHFSTADLQIRPGDGPAVSVAVTNTGAVAATDIVQLYLTRAPHRRQQRLLGWARVALSPGQTQRATIAISPLLLCDWDQATHDWRRDAGAYDIAIGTSAADLTLSATLHLAGQHIKP